MPVKSNASPDEKYSAFYKKNKALCEKWEDFVLNTGGKIIGNYNSMSFVLKCKITAKRTWVIDVIKDTVIDGHYWFLSKYKGNKEMITYKAIISEECANFRIKKSKIYGKGRKSIVAKEVYKLVKPAIENNTFKEARLNSKELHITLCHANDWFEFTNRVLAY